MTALRGVLQALTLYLSVVSAILVPLYMKNGYFGLNEAKAGFCFRFAAPAAIVALLLYLVGYLCSVYSEGYRVYRIRISAILLAAIAVWALFSTYLSPNPGLSLWGTVGWSVGSAMTVLLVTMTFLYSRNLSFRPNLLYPLIIINIVIFFIAVLQSTGKDPFGLLRQVDPVYRFTYLSTIGQKNAAAGYLCLLLPLFWGLFISCTERFSALIYGGVSFLGFFCIILCESDSVYAGIGISLLCIIPFVFSEGGRIPKTGILLCIYGVSLFLVGYSPFFVDKKTGMRGFSAMLINFPCAFVFTISGILIYILSRKLLQTASPAQEKRCLRILVIVLESILITAILIYIFYTATHFSDHWGTMRGRTWRIGMEAFWDFPLRRKLTGIGPEMLAMIYSELRTEQRINIVSAHSDPLQVLFTQGIVGAVLYLLFWGYLLYLFIFKKLWRDNRAIFFFPIAAYWGQSLFCSIYPVTGVLFSVMAGLYFGQVED